jgi:transposase
MGYKTGASRNQITLLPESIDEHIREENAVRVIDIYINSLDMEKLGIAKSRPNETGRPAYSPQDMLKLV